MKIMAYTESIVVDVPGIAKALQLQDLEESCRIHNGLFPDTAFPPPDDAAIEALSTIVIKFKQHKQFRVCLLHRHTTMTKGQILLGSRITKPPGIWTAPTSVKDVDLSKIYGHIYSFDATSSASAALKPSEFRRGPPTTIGSVEPMFFIEFVECLKDKGLEDTYGLELIRGEYESMIEFSFDIGSLLIAQNEVVSEVWNGKKPMYTTQQTCWAAKTDDDLVDATGEVRCAITGGQHVRLVNTTLTTFSGVIELLEKDGILLAV